MSSMSTFSNRSLILFTLKKPCLGRAKSPHSLRKCSTASDV